MEIQRMLKWIHRIEDGLLVVMIAMMMIMAVLQIVLRNISDSGIIWGDPLVRILVLWAGLLGAMAATRRNNHINIDIITRYLPHKVKRLSAALTGFTTSGLCFLTAWYSLDFVLLEKEFGTMAFAEVPAWICQSIIPLAFFVIAVRFLLLSINPLFRRDTIRRP